MEARQLAHRVVAIAGLCFVVHRLQQPDFVVVAQRSNRDLSKSRKLADFEHETVVKPHATGESRGFEKRKAIATAAGRAAGSAQMWRKEARRDGRTKYPDVLQIERWRGLWPSLNLRTATYWLSGHGQDAETFERTTIADLKPRYLADTRSPSCLRRR
jgi:hypothetical protein